MAARATEPDVETLVVEIHRYLDAVDAFRALGSEPCWRAEPQGIPSLAGNQGTRQNARKRRGSAKPREGG